MSHSALLLLDPQRDFFEPAPPNADEFHEAAGVINAAIRAFHEVGSPVVVVQHTSPKKPEGSWEHGVWEKFDIDTGDQRVNKGYADAFWASELAERLDDLGIDRVVLSEFLSHVCVLGTYFGAMVRAYDPRILERGTASLGVGDRSRVEALVRTVSLEQMVAEMVER